MTELPPALQAPQIPTNLLNLDHRERQKQHGGHGEKGRNRLTGDTHWVNAATWEPLHPKEDLESLAQAESSD